MGDPKTRMLDPPSGIVTVIETAQLAIGFTDKAPESLADKHVTARGRPKLE